MLMPSTVIRAPALKGTNESRPSRYRADAESTITCVESFEISRMARRSRCSGSGSVIQI